MTARSSTLGRPIEFRPPTGWVYTDTGTKLESSPEVEIKCAHCGKPNVMMPVPIPPDLSCDGVERWKVKHIDACIAPVVKALNDAGILTRSSCCGHGTDGSIELWNGRTLIVKRKEDRQMASEEGRPMSEQGSGPDAPTGTLGSPEYFRSTLLQFRDLMGQKSFWASSVDTIMGALSGLMFTFARTQEATESDSNLFRATVNEFQRRQELVIGLPQTPTPEERVDDTRDLIQRARSNYHSRGTGLICLPIEPGTELHQNLVELCKQLGGLDWSVDFERDRSMEGTPGRPEMMDQFAITFDVAFGKEEADGD